MGMSVSLPQKALLHDRFVFLIFYTKGTFILVFFVPYFRLNEIVREVDTAEIFQVH
jgi:hypothetical protein